MKNKKSIEIVDDITSNGNYDTNVNNNDYDYPNLNVIALGGTFDHLHVGHKVMLSLSDYLAESKVIIAVSGEFRRVK